MAHTSLRRLAVVVGAGALILGALTGVSDASPSTTPESQRAPEAQQFAKENVTTAGELRTVSSSLTYAGRQQVIKHFGATYVKVHFSSLRLNAGEYVTVSSPDSTESYRYGGANSSDYTTDPAGQGFWAMSIDGDTAVVTVHSTRRSPGTAATIDKFWRGYTPQEIEAHNPSIMSVCGTDARRDVVCYQSSHPTEYAKGNAVARLLIGGGGLCTTWRVGTTNRMLTNNHCIGSQSDVTGSESQFNYQCATCGGNNPGAGTKVSGATMYKTSGDGGSGLDYTLYSVNNFSNITQYGTLYLHTRAPTTGERIYIPGHGDGKPKRLSIYEDTQGGALCTVKNAASDSYNMGYSCDTSGGNSGSPVLAADHKVIALHHLGGCPNEGARMALIYPQISSMIDNGGGTPPPPTGPRFENATNVTISDNTTVYSSVNATGMSGNAPTGLKVEVDIKHTWRGDLVLSLIAPDGTVYLLEDFPNSDSGDNVLKTYTVNASSEVANGTWRLRVQDVATYDTGYIDRWALQF
ncbi:MAG: proprotein convertase P-domain-containing protein [Micromonosporaceae bacterium]